ncbi:MAG: HU family DNA-binding protein [Candidatus Tectomicrobia bacterium]|nr:HU family DNA-binding protein [Candidatus Tectomicrobia bacterium]
MTKIDIVNRVAEAAGLTQVKAEEAVDCILALVKHTLGEGEGVILRRFGSFYVTRKGARIGRNPKTGEEAKIPPRKVVRFKSGKYFRDAVNSATPERPNTVW